MTSSQPHLDVLFILLRIWRIYLSILGSDEGRKQVVRQRLRLIQSHIHVLIELLRKRIAVINSKDTFEDIQVYSNVKVLPCVVVSELADHFGDLLTLQEHSLRNP